MKAFSHRTLIGVLAMGAIATAAFAGQQEAQEVIFNTTKSWASGDLGYVRNTADGVQHIGCVVYGANGICTARNSAGVSHSCTTTDPDLVNNMRALNGDSRLEFAWNADGTCKAVQVYNDSRYPTK